MDKQDLFETVIATFGVDSQKAMAIEECAELINALCKEKRGRATDEDIITEIADVQIMCDQLAIIYGKERVRQERLRKLFRLSNRVQNKEQKQTEEVKEQNAEWIMTLGVQKQVTIKNACKWLDKNLPDMEYITNASPYRQSKREFIESFRKAMEGHI